MERKGLASYLFVTLKGICMGAADVIPGVSGGTIAFLTGIYEELVNSIKSIDATAIKLLFTGKIAQFWKKINANFLVSLVAGIFISVFSLAKVMVWLMENHPIPLWSFFFGLIFISAVFIFRGMKNLTVLQTLSAIVGLAFGAFICLVSPGETTEALWFVFICGIIGICAMILPGISGSFILLLMGKYQFIMDAIGNFKLGILVVFASGALIGIISFSHFLSWLLKKYYNGTLMFLAGLMLGSLVKVWPWKVMLDSGVERPILPSSAAGDPLVGQAIVWFVIGAALVVTIEFIAKRLKK